VVLLLLLCCMLPAPPAAGAVAGEVLEGRCWQRLLLVVLIHGCPGCWLLLRKRGHECELLPWVLRCNSVRDGPGHCCCGAGATYWWRSGSLMGLGRLCELLGHGRVCSFCEWGRMLSRNVEAHVWLQITCKVPYVRVAIYVVHTRMSHVQQPNLFWGRNACTSVRQS